MTTNPELSIDIHLPLDAQIIGGVSYNHDGEPTANPTTVLDAVIERAARIVADSVAGRISSYGSSYDSGVSKLYHSLVEPRVNAILSDRVDAALAAMLRPSVRYGEPQGEPIPLAEWIAAKVDEQLNKGRGDAYNRKPSVVESAVESFVSREVVTALDKAMKDAKTKALAAFSRVAEQKMAEALRESIARAVA